MKVNIEPDDLDVRIEIIPLIDIIFCILVFFLLGAVNTGRTEGLNVDLPKASSGQPQFGDSLKVEVDALGQIIIENTVVSKDQLSQLLALYVAQKPQGIVEFQADKRLNYETVIDLFDLLRKVGGTRVALGTTNQTVPSPPLTPGGPTVPNTSGQLNPNLPPLPNTLPNTLPNSLPNTIPDNVPVIPTTPNNTVPNPAGGVPPNSSKVPQQGVPQGTQPLQQPGIVP